MVLKNKTEKLNNRNISEQKFHNKKYSSVHKAPAHYKYNPISIIYLRIKKMIGGISKKDVLEYGCGNGWLTAELASIGGKIYSFDISEEAIKTANLFLSKHNLSQNVCLKKMSGEELEYPDNSFDVVVGFAILHHLDLDKAIPEIYRVMKPSACAYFAEPLGTNPLINFYRKLTPEFRTVDESPIVLDEFKVYVKKFRKWSHEEYYLTALLPLFLSHVPVLRNFAGKLMLPLMNLDKKLLIMMPILGKFAWYSIFTLHK